MHINSCDYAIDKSNLSIYKYLLYFIANKNGIINDDLHKVISSISRLEDKAYEVIKSNIQCNSRDISLSNVTATSYISSFIPRSGTSADINQTNHQKYWFLS